jgi:integrase
VRYWYYRRPGCKRVRLFGDYGSEQFAECYRLATIGGTAPPCEVGADRTVRGTVNHLIVLYKKSTHWTRLADNSKRNRGPIMETLRAGPWGAAPVRQLTTKHIREILEAVDAMHGKKHWLKTLRGLFNHAVELELIEDDPSAGIKVKVPTTNGYWAWLDEEIAKFRAYWRLGSVPRLVMEFALETASRRCEVARLGRQHVKGGRIDIARVKGCNAVDIVVTPALDAAIRAMPPSDHLLYLIDGDKPYTVARLGAKFAEWATEAGLPQRCRLHGLRKARTTQLANKGVHTLDIMGVTGHKSIAEVQRYTATFERRQAGDRAMAILLAAENESEPGPVKRRSPV